MDINEERLAFSRTWVQTDHTIHAGEDPKKQVAAMTSGDFPTVVFDATGNVQSMNGAFELAAHGGTLVFVGLVKSDIVFHDPEFHKRELTLLSSRNATRQDFEHVMETVGRGTIDVERYVTHRATLDNLVHEFDRWLMPESKVIKAMVEL
ncbi:zinc-binding dehydrogenase [Paenibacillus sp. GYB003]|uniref:zinc-binding dehydrogenase n=1 Tax=Paenibacillus sp. GYB003 TaxID=2994392 RepID=UPI002F961620